MYGRKKNLIGCQTGEPYRSPLEVLKKRKPTKANKQNPEAAEAIRQPSPSFRLFSKTAAEKNKQARQGSNASHRCLPSITRKNLY